MKDLYYSIRFEIAIIFALFKNGKVLVYGGEDAVLLRSALIRLIPKKYLRRLYFATHVREPWDWNAINIPGSTFCI